MLITSIVSENRYLTGGGFLLNLTNYHTDKMPTLLLILGYSFFFYSNEGNEPAHVHVTKAEKFGKIWLEPDLQTAYLNGFSSSEQKQILEIITENAEMFKTKWYEYFGK